MRCPVCEHENSSLATRCAACGAMLPNPTSTDSSLEPSTTMLDNAAEALDATAEALDATAEALDTTAEALDVSALEEARNTAEQPRPPFSDTSMAMGEDPLLRNRDEQPEEPQRKRGRIVELFVSHQRAFGIGLALSVIVVLGVVWLVINVIDAPAYTKIEADLAERIPTFEYVGGVYGPDLQIPLSSVGVTQRSGTKTPEGMDAGEGIGSAAYGVEAEAIYDDGKIRAARNVSATYVRNDGDWTITGELGERDTTFTARSGVDEQKVLNNIGTILEAASPNDGDSLAQIYDEGSFSIVGNVFTEAGNKDTATDDVTIHCTKKYGFYAYDGNVTARFAFESGSWVLRSAEADDRVGMRSFTPLVGTWRGELAESISNGATCYGAQGQELRVAIESVGDPSAGSGKVSGTISVLAHYHQKLQTEQSTTQGDTPLERLSFTGTIKAEHNEQTGSDITVECTTTGSPQSNLSFTLSFGTNEDPSAVMAIVTSTHTYEEKVLLFIPHQTTAKFVDTYALSRG